MDISDNEEVFDWSPLCPICGSKNTDESIMMDRGVIDIDKECLKCGVEWTDNYIFNGLDIRDKEVDELFI